MKQLSLIILLLLLCSCTAKKDWDAMVHKDVTMLDGHLKVIFYHKTGMDEYDVVTPRVTGMHPSSSRTTKSSSAVLQFDWPENVLNVSFCIPEKTVLMGRDIQYRSIRSGILEKTVSPKNVEMIKNEQIVSKLKCNVDWNKPPPCLSLSSDRKSLLNGYYIYNADTLAKVVELDEGSFSSFLEYIKSRLPTFNPSGLRVFPSNDRKEVIATYSNYALSMGPTDVLGYIYNIETGDISKVPLPVELSENFYRAAAVEEAGNYYFLLEWEQSSNKMEKKTYYSIFSYPDKHWITLSEKADDLYLRVFGFHWDIKNKRVISVQGWHLDQLEVKVLNYEKDVFLSNKLCIGKRGQSRTPSSAINLAGSSPVRGIPHSPR